MNQREASHLKAEPAGVSVETSQGSVSQEDVQSSSPSFHDSEKVCGSTHSCPATRSLCSRVTFSLFWWF